MKYEKKLVLLCEVGEGLESEAGGTVEALQDRLGQLQHRCYVGCYTPLVLGQFIEFGITLSQR